MIDLGAWVRCRCGGFGVAVKPSNKRSSGELVAFLLGLSWSSDSVRTPWGEHLAPELEAKGYEWILKGQVVAA